MVAVRIAYGTIAAALYGVVASVAAIRSFEATEANSGIGWLLVALVSLVGVAVALGSWWSLGLPFLPVIPVAAWDEANCHDDFLEFCGLAPAALAIMALVVGVPAAAIATALSPRRRHTSRGPAPS